MKILRSKRADISINEILWRTSKIVLTLLVLIVMWAWAHDRATGEDLDKKFMTRDVALLSGTTLHVPGDVEFAYDPLVADLSGYEVTVRNSWVIINRPGIKDRQFYRYYRNDLLGDFDFQNHDNERLIFIKSGNSVGIGLDSIGDDACEKPDPHNPASNILMFPSYHEPFPGLTNPDFIDTNGHQLIEELVTADIGSSAAASGHLSMSAESVRAAGQQNLDEAAVIAMTSGKEAFIVLMLDNDQDINRNEVVAFIKPGSEHSRYMACLITARFGKDFPSLTSTAIVPSMLPIIAQSNARATVLLMVGNVDINENALLDSSSRPALKQSLYGAIGKYYEP